MTKVCVIGNSHVAALKLGWPEIQAQFPRVELTCFASAGLSVAYEVSDGKLVCPDPRIKQRLAYTSQTDGDIRPVYDVYILCGLALSSMKAFRAYIAKRVELKAAGTPIGTTVEDYAAAMAPALRDTIAIDVAAKLRTLTQAPIFVIATPLPAYERHVELWGRIKENFQESTVAQAYDLACTRVAAEHDAVFLPQPVEVTDESGLTTRNQFYLLKPEQVAEEKSLHTHMNPAFGAVVLRDALEKIVNSG